MQVAAENGALVMVHAENGDAIDVLVKEALAAGNTAPKYHALTRPPGDRGRGDEPGDPARARRRLAAVRRPRLLRGRRSSRSSARARRAGTSTARPAPSTSSVDYSYLEQPGFEGGEVRLHAAAAGRRRNQDVLWDAVRTDVLSVVSTDHCAFLWDGQKTWATTTSRRSRTAAPGSRSGSRCSTSSACAPAGFAQPHGRSCSRRIRRSCSGSIRARARSRSDRDADIVVFDPEKTVTISVDDAPLEVRLQPVRGHRGDRRPGGRAAPRTGARRGRRARRITGRRPVRARARSSVKS